MRIGQKFARASRPGPATQAPSAGLRVRSRTCAYALLVLHVLFVPLFASADTLPAPSSGLPVRLQLTYALSRGTLEIARIDEVYERKGGRYLLQSEARAVGLAALVARGQGWRRESEGVVTRDGLRPERFTDQRGNNPTQRARMDWDARQIRFDRLPSSGEAETGAPETLPAGTTDRLSFPYSIAQRATLPEGEWDAPLTDGRRLTRYRFKVVGRETVITPAGSFDALRVTRVTAKDEAGTDVWLAISRQMIPVRILVTESDGTVFDQVLVKIGPP